MYVKKYKGKMSLKNLTEKEYRKLHVILHEHLDTVIRDMIRCTGLLPNDITATVLVDWSYEQTRE